MRLIAHRGCPLLHLENTIPSFLKAVELGYEMIEMDIQQTLDNKLVVFHDDTLERLSIDNVDQTIQELTYAELQKIPLIDNNRIPLLLDVLDLLEDKIQLNLEVKSVGAGPLLAEVLKCRKPKYPYLISSFHWNELHAFDHSDTHLNFAVLTENLSMDAINYAFENGFTYIHFSKENLTSSLMEDLVNRGLEANIYTINDLSEIEHLNQDYIAGIFTDNHNLLIA